MRVAKENPGKARSPDLEDKEQVAHEEKTFFDSFYSASVRGQAEDRNTIGAITQPESRYHYNVVENAIIRAMLRRQPPARDGMIEAARMLQERNYDRCLDIGSGTGHWIDFMRETFLVSELVGIEIADAMVKFLTDKYADEPGIGIVQVNIADDDFDPGCIGEPVDYITAIGVMFHIVDDARWRVAVRNIGRCLKPGGVLFIGGDFGPETANVQFHKDDSFKNWREFERGEGKEGQIRVNKRVRALHAWIDLLQSVGLSCVDLVRTERDPIIMTPENDVLVVWKPVPES